MRPTSITNEAWKTQKGDNGFWGTKLDWRINDNHLLELLAFSDKADSVTTYYDSYDWTNERLWFIGGRQLRQFRWFELVGHVHRTDHRELRGQGDVRRQQRSAVSSSPLDGTCSIVTRSGNYTAAFGPATLPGGYPSTNSSVSVIVTTA